MTRSTRRGFTLIEIMIVVVLLGLVMGTLMTVIVRQQRFYRNANQIMDSRSQIRQAVTILPVDLRGISTVGGDILALTDSAVEIRATYGSSVICDKFAGDSMSFAPTGQLSAGSGNVLTSFLTTPAVGDTLFVYDTATAVIANPWTIHRVTGVSTTTSALTCGVLSGYTALGDAAKTKTVVRVSPVLSATENKGSPVRFTRRVRYNIYVAGDSKWYLGYNQYTNGAWAGLQPVSGPYKAYTTDTLTSGLNLRYYQEDGTEVTSLGSATQVARIRLWVRAQAGQGVSLYGRANATTWQDYLNLTVAIRNRI